MDNKDIKILISLLKEHSRDDIVDLLIGAQGELDESSTFGSYAHSTLSQFLIYSPVKNYVKLKKLQESDCALLHSCILDIHPHGDNLPEITSVNFRLLNGNAEDDLVAVAKEVNHDFVREQIDKCNDKIEREDYDGAISSAGSLLEGVFDDIHKRCLGNSIGSTSDLCKAYKKIKDLLLLSETQYSNQEIKSIMHGLSKVVSGVDSVRNQMGDRHKISDKPQKRHTKLCVNATFSISEFLYETLEYQHERIIELYNELVELLDGDLRRLPMDGLLSASSVIEHLSKYDQYLKNNTKDYFIREYRINRYRESDIFFSAMKIFFDVLNKKDIDIVFHDCYQNDQACGLMGFLEMVKNKKGELLSKGVIGYIEVVNEI